MAAAHSLDVAAQRLARMTVPRVDPPASVDPGPLGVAIVVPTFREELHLRQCLESIRAQTYPHWRCYVIDDASSLDVGAIVDGFSVADDRFTLVRHGRNAGLSAARNTGVLLASEALIQFLDADDMLTPWALEARVDRARRHWSDPTVAGVYGYIAQCTDETRPDDLRTWRSKRVELPVQDWLTSRGESPFNVHAPLLRTDVVRRLAGFDETLLNGAEDWDLWHRALRHGYVFVPVNTVVGAYRQRMLSMVRQHSGLHLRRADSLLRAAESWAIVDPDVAVGDATMPISVAASSLQRAIRGARWAGMRAAQLSDPVDAVDAEIEVFVHETVLPSSRRQELVAAAHGGLVRGLGLSREVVPLLDERAQERLHLAATAIADKLLSLPRATRSPTTDAIDLTLRFEADVALVAETAADARPLLDHCASVGIARSRTIAIDIEAAQGEQGARHAWEHHDQEIAPYSALLFGRLRITEVIVREPLGPVARELIETARSTGALITTLSEPDRGVALSPRPDDPSALRPRPAGRVGPVAVEPLGARFNLLLPTEEGAIDSTSSDKLRDLRDRHRGETAVIVGNGPSLNETDLQLLAGHATFGVNAIYLASERLPDRLTYYVVEDRAVFHDNSELIKRYDAGTKLFPAQYRRYFEGDDIPDNTAFFRMNTGFYGRQTGTYCHPRFSTNAAQRVYCGQSVTIINLQLAHWMGFNASC